MNISDRFKNSTYKVLMKSLKKNNSGFELKFYFSDDPSEKEMAMVYNPDSKKPYYIEDDRLSRDNYFETSDELISAPIFNNQTLKDRWDNVKIITVNNMTFDDWKESHKY